MFAGLTEQICATAFDMVGPTIEWSANEEILSRYAGHVVVLNPSIPYEPKYRSVINSDGEINEKFFDLALWENSFGGDDLKQMYITIARAKAFTSFMTGLPSHLVQQQFPSLYIPGMTKWGGSAIAGVGPMRLIVAFSGVQWNFDQMISEMMISAIQALCHEQMREVMESKEVAILTA